MKKQMEVLKPSHENTMFFVNKGYKFIHGYFNVNQRLQKDDKIIEIFPDKYVVHHIDNVGRVIESKTITK